MTPRFKTDPLKKQLPDSKRCEFKESDGSRCENEALYFVTYNDKRVRCCAVDWRNDCRWAVEPVSLAALYLLCFSPAILAFLIVRWVRRHR